MRILYISYWGIDDVLTSATVIPNLALLRTYSDTIVLCTVERSPVTSTPQLPPGVIHLPVQNFLRLPRFLRKLTDYVRLYIVLLKIKRRYQITTVICRGAMAGSFGYLLYKRFGLPFYVESFEPHANYMVEGGTWRRNGIEHRIQSFFEKKQIQFATGLMPVTFNYQQELIMTHSVSPERVKVMPCCVDTDKFRFSKAARVNVRKRLQISDGTITGIYVGKFGDIYYDNESFEIFKTSFEVFEGNFFLIILSPESREEILLKSEKYGIPASRVFVSKVSHADVPDFLSAADFAFSLIRSTPSRRFCSPIKNGEYWANGLLILLTEGVGDDEHILGINDAGAVINTSVDSVKLGLLHIKKQINEKTREELNKKISTLARQHRNFQIIAKAYRQLF